MKKPLRKKRGIRILVGSGLILGLIVLIAFIWLKSQTYGPMEAAVEAIQQENVTVEGRVIRLEPEGEPVANLVFYPGGLVEAEAYAVLGQSLAERGVRVFIPKMPLNLAILHPNAFDRIYKQYGDENDWYIGGHSLGGASASIYASEQSEHLTGVFLLGAYPSGNSDLSNLQIPVVSIDATRDQIMVRDQYEQRKTLLPPETDYIRIEGGNHSQFGYYGFQKGDGKSLLSREEQHKQVVDAIMNTITSTADARKE